MTRLKQIFLLDQNGANISTIAKAIGSSRNTVKKYLKLAEDKKMSVGELEKKHEHELERIFAEPVKRSKGRLTELEALFPSYVKELSRTGVTRWILWGEYKVQYPDGYCYSQFCDLFSKWLKKDSSTMHLEHKPGDKAYIDFTGKKLQVVDPETGEITEVEVYVCQLGYSHLTYVEAVSSQKKHDFIKATENALRYFGGAPKALVPDNLKSAVTKANKYEPEINEDFLDFANHYNTSVYPARSRKPKDKAIVESSVKTVYSRIFAPLRDKIFFSLKQLNIAISELLEKHNNQNFQREQVSRRKKFEQSESNMLISLPVEPYQVKKYKKGKVMKNGHVQLEKHYYSVPYQYIGKVIKVIYTNSEVNIFYKQDRIAFHTRSYKNYAYSTVQNHLSSTHRFISDWNPEKFINWAERIHPVVKSYIEKVLQQKIYPEQAYRSCVGILSFEKKMGKWRLIKAIERATYYQVYNYKAIKKILDGGLDMLFEQERQSDKIQLPDHENIRGAEHYK